MGKLRVDSSKKLNFTKVANAVYKTLSQEEDMYCEIVFMDENEMQELNNSARNVNSVTDVLSFPSLDGIRNKVIYRKDYPFSCDGEELFIGSIVLCNQKIKSQAEELGHSELRERTYLVVHGLMHLFGFDHIDEQDKKEMRQKEKEALAFLGIKE